jgi:hypothetical protein
MADFGGIIKFRLPDGRNLSVRGSVNHMPGRFSYEKVVNTDGSVDRSAKVEGYEFSLNFANREQITGLLLDFDALMAQSGVTFTFLGDTEKVDRIFNNASLTGRPSVDDMTGEVSGISGVAESYLALPR